MAFSTKTAQFAWKHINIMIMGRLITGVTDIEYTSERNIEEIYGAGDSPQYLGEGNRTYSGTIELLQNEYEALVEYAKSRLGNDLLDIEIDIVVNYLPKELPAMMKMVTDRVVGCKFTSAGKKMTQGDTHQKIQLPFRALYVENQMQ
jgi:hypothetical protein